MSDKERLEQLLCGIVDAARQLDNGEYVVCITRELYDELREHLKPLAREAVAGKDGGK